MKSLPTQRRMRLVRRMLRRLWRMPRRLTPRPFGGRAGFLGRAGDDGFPTRARRVLLAAGAFALWRPSPQPLGPFTARPITSDPGIERDPDISPDGKYVAYAASLPSFTRASRSG